MRAYVIMSGHEDQEVHPEPLAVVSSKQSAITACEHYLETFPETTKIKWKKLDKHTGYATRGDNIVSYKMFFINRENDNAAT